MDSPNWRQVCYPFNLGTYERDVTVPPAPALPPPKEKAGEKGAETKEEGAEFKPAEAKLWFARGMIWYYAFNREEAAACFKEALRCCPNMAMAHWGIAISNGVNYNQWEMLDDMVPCKADAYRHSRKAHELREQCSELEKALIDALQRRYTWPFSDDQLPKLNQDYADAMKGVYERFPDDPDVAALYAEARMMLRPWNLWDIVNGEPREGTVEIQNVLEHALDIAPDHPGLTHLYIHVVEMSPRPEIALEVADRIYTLVPDSGHMIHMATHIYLSLGMYDKTIELNQLAVDCDRKYLAHEPNQRFFKFYVAHNWHFIVYAAAMNGQYAIARNAAEEMRKVLPLTGEPLPYRVMNELTDGFATMLYHVLMRFGKWDEILSVPFPQPASLYPFSTATLRFTRAIALASMGRVNDALDEEQLFLQAWNEVPPDATFIFNNCRRILEVAKEMLRGEIKYRQADYRQAFEHLRRAAQLEDSLQYDEPWPWMQPVRHALGALLLEQGRLNEAEEAFRQDLSKRGTGSNRGNPNNIWSLVGMQQCLERLGRTEEAKRIAGTLKKARDAADTPIRASCFCATELIQNTAST